MPVEHTPESIADAIRPTLDAFTRGAAPYLKRITDELYEQLLNSTQDYLRENGEWNIGQEIDRCRRVDAENQRLRAVNAELLTELRDAAETFRHYERLHRAKDTVDGEIKANVNAAKAERYELAIARATQETPHAG